MPKRIVGDVVFCRQNSHRFVTLVATEQGRTFFHGQLFQAIVQRLLAVLQFFGRAFNRCGDGVEVLWHKQHPITRGLFTQCHDLVFSDRS